jgi:hypothetical protein
MPFALPFLASHIGRSRVVMDKFKSKQRAIGILFVLASILVLIAAWDLPEDRSA